MTTVSPIRTDIELAQTHLRLDELLAAQTYNLPSQDIRDELEVLTALIYYYEQRTSRIKEGIRQSDRGETLPEAEVKKHLSSWLTDTGTATR